MADLFMLLTPVVIGLAFGQALSLILNPFVVREVTPATAPESEYPKEWDEPFKDEWAEAKATAKKQVTSMAKRALEACPDVSCDQVAEAFGLNKMSVRRLSKGGRTGKRVRTNYSAEEIREMANG